MVLQSERKKDSLIVRSSPHVMWTVVAVAIFAGGVYKIYQEIELFDFDLTQPTDLAYAGICGGGLLLVLFLQVLQPERVTQYDMRLRRLTRAVRTNIGGWHVDVPMADIVDSEAYEINAGPNRGFAVGLVTHRGRVIPVATELSWVQAEELDRRVRASLLSKKRKR